MCTSKNENKKRFAQAHTTHNPKQPHEIQNKKCNNRICAMNSDTKEPSRLYREFEQLTFDAVRTFRRIFPDKVDDLGQPILGSTKKELTILTAYNGSSIVQHGSVYIQCAHKGKWTTLEFFVVTTEGPTIIRLPSFRNLELISLHCTIEENKGPINPIVELTNSYPNQFDHIGHFKSDYHIVLKPNHDPYIWGMRSKRNWRPWNPKALLENLASLSNGSTA